MRSLGKIITVGLSPAWDIICRGAVLDWGRHADIDEQVVRPAGKALNVSYALAWMGCQSVAAGLWGRDDVEPMRRAVSRWAGLVEAKMTVAEGRTRQNVTVVDTAGPREMHLRSKSTLATPASLRRLRAGVKRIVRKGDVCVFAGAMPADDLLEPVTDLARTCRDLGARIVVDTYGSALKGFTDAKLPWLIAPNIEELGGLLGLEVADTPARLAAAGRTLLGKTEAILVSRGRNGAVFVTRDAAWKGRCRSRGRVLSTVGCGDYLLAGFLAGFCEDGDPQAALMKGLRAATARAWGWTETRTWPETAGAIEVAVARF